MKLDLLTNATVVDDAIRFVSQKAKDKETSSPASSSDDDEKEESNESDYDEDKDQLEEKTGEISSTRNQIF